jgi:muramidase (phage lysozyme)
MNATETRKELSIMDHPEKWITMSTQDTGRRQTKNKKHQVLRNIWLTFSNKAGEYKAKAFNMW